MADAKFHALSGMRDHGCTFGLRSGPSSCRDGDQRRKRLIGIDVCWWFFPLKRPQIDVVSGGQADGFAAIHRTATAYGDDRIMAT